MKNKKLYITLFTISIIFLGIGGSFAYLTTSVTATNITQVKAGNLTMTIDGGGNSNVTLFPSKCTSEYAIKKKIVVSAKNTSGGKVSFSVGMNVAVLSDSLKRTTMKYALSTSATSCTDGLIANGNFKDATQGSDIWIVKNDYDNITQSSNTYTKTYYLYIWLDESETENISSGNISVNMKGTSSNNPGLTTEAVKSVPLYDMIKSSADTTTQIDFSQTSAASSTNGIYMTTDTDSGNPVYYYRGNVDNRVIFANFCWRIVRTTETGGVKLIYDGVPIDFTPIKESSYVNVINDATYPYTFDSTNKTWTSTNKTDSTTGTITFSVDTAGDYVMFYVMSSEAWDQAIFYKNDTELERHNKIETGTISLTGLTTSDIIKVEYRKNSSVSSGNDTVVFSVGKVDTIGQLIKLCVNEEDDTSIGESKFNESYGNAKYLGYMYGNSIDDTENTNDSTIKTVVDTWYKNNMTSYTSQLEDIVFCNDRSYTTSNNDLYFGAYTRLYTNKSPTLKCQNEKDRFTVEESNGNGLLTYPVGLLTADEMAYAGAVYDTGNHFFYLNSSFDWSLSPYTFVSWIAVNFYRYSGGALMDQNVVGNEPVHPSVSLKSGTEISSGSGTATDPFIVN